MVGKPLPTSLASGQVDINRLSVYLGHHSASFTLAVYAHLLPDREDQALRAIEAALEADDGAGPIARESAES